MLSGAIIRAAKGRPYVVTLPRLTVVLPPLRTYVLYAILVLAQSERCSRKGEENTHMTQNRMITVSFPSALRARVEGRTSITVTGQTVREVIDALDRDFPGLRFNLCHETGELRPYVNIFVNSQNIRYLQGLDTEIAPGARLHILPSVAGG